MPHTVQESATCLQIKFEDQIQSDKDIRTLARKGTFYSVLCLNIRQALPPIFSSEMHLKRVNQVCYLLLFTFQHTSHSLGPMPPTRLT